MERKFSRIEPSLQVTLVFPYAKYDSYQVEDLSLTGMFVKGIFATDPGTHCLAFLMPKQDQKTSFFQASAKVVRKNDSGIALEFTTMTIESYMYLQVALLYEASKPLEIMLELPEDCPFILVDQLPTGPARDIANILG